MYKPSQLRNYPPEVQEVILDLNKEEACSNLNQARIGKRVPFNEKSFGNTTSLKEEHYRDDETGDTVSVEFIDFNEPNPSGKEPLKYKMTKYDD